METDFSGEALAIVIVFPNTQSRSNTISVKPNESTRPFDRDDWSILAGMLLLCVLVVGWLVWLEGKKTHVPILKRTKNPWRRYKCVGYRNIKR